MRSTIVLGAGLALLLGSSLLARGERARVDDDEPDGAAIAEAAKIFGSNCVNCHVPPDPQFPTDRAWLHQVQETA